MLEIAGLNAGYGRSQVLFDIDLTVRQGECVCLLGRNGMGKTTTMRAAMNLTPPMSGTVTFEGKNLAGKSPYEITRLGLSLVPEDRRIFADLTVLENIEVADAGREWTIKRVFDLFPELAEFSARKGGLLSGGQQQMLTIARSLMTSPKLLLLDEPSEGLAPLVVERLREQIIKLKSSGVTLVLAEQSLAFCLSVSERVYVLEKGVVKHSEDTVSFAANHALQTQLLGVGH